MAAFFGFDLGMNLGTMGSATGIFILIFIVFLITRTRSEHDALWGTSTEGRFVREAKFERIAGLLRKGVKSSEARRRKERALQKNAKKDEKKEKKGGFSKGEIAAVRAEEDDVKVAQDEARSEEEEDALGGRVIGLLASGEVTAKEIAAFAGSEQQRQVAGEQDISAAERIINTLQALAGSGTRDTEYLSRILSQIKEFIDKSVEKEREKIDAERELVPKVREAVQEARGVIKAANTALADLQKAEKKEIIDFEKEVGDISAAIAEKEKLLLSAKEGDKSELTNQIKILMQNKNAINSINGQIKNSYNAVQKDIQWLKRLFKLIADQEASLGKDEKEMERWVGNAERHYKELKAAAAKLEVSAEKLANPQLFLNSFLNDVTSFYSRYQDSLRSDIYFHGLLITLLGLNFRISKDTEEYGKLSIQLDEAQKALERGIASATQVVEAIVGGQNEKIGAEEVLRQLQTSVAEINAEERGEQLTGFYARQAEMESVAEIQQLRKLIAEDWKVHSEVQSAVAARRHRW